MTKIIKKENKTQYAILGILSLDTSKPMSGYDIRKTMANSTQYFWQESNGQLYPTLSKLVLNKEIKITQPNKDSNKNLANNKNKITYAITNTGKKKLTQWLLKEADYYTHRSELLLKVFFGQHVDPAVSIKHIQSRLKSCQDQLIIFESIASETAKLVAKKKQPLYFLLTVNAGIKLIQAEINWCEESLSLIKANKK